MPFMGKLIVGIGQIVNKLIVKVYNIVDHVVADYGFFRSNQ